MDKITSPGEQPVEIMLDVFNKIKATINIASLASLFNDTPAWKSGPDVAATIRYIKETMVRSYNPKGDISYPEFLETYEMLTKLEYVFDAMHIAILPEPELV